MDERDVRQEQATNGRKIPLHKEVVDVKRERVVVEEIHIKKKKVTKTKQFIVPVRREELVIEHRKLTEGPDGEEAWTTTEVEVIPIREERGEALLDQKQSVERRDAPERVE